jgi:hypothetical protein
MVVAHLNELNQLYFSLKFFKIINLIFCISISYVHNLASNFLVLKYILNIFTLTNKK